MLSLQEAIDHIAAACLAEGITEAVICPGSRNAPLTIAFVRSGKFNCVSVADERSAAFIAMGKALAIQKPVVLICTSGSAVANFYPAVLEAYYQKIPLIVLTADRPPEMIDQWDGQTIRQAEIFGPHVLGYWQTPDFYDTPALFAQLTTAAIKRAIFPLAGPVHINVPLHEPLYPSPTRPYTSQWVSEEGEVKNLKAEFFDSSIYRGKKVLVLRGMRQKKVNHTPNGVAIYEDVMSGGGDSETVSERLFMNSSPDYLEALRPDVLLSDGTAVLSKPLKQFLRKYPPAEHFHFSIEGEIADPFGTQPTLVRASLEDYLVEIESYVHVPYTSHILKESNASRLKHTAALENSSWNEFKAIYTTLKQLPEATCIHAANSMAIRYVAYCEPQKQGHFVYANRGTSGIDGCVSTALGFASMNKGPNYLFVGDVAFFYDSNAFWNALGHLPLKVILINNGGGGIFRMIDGPASQPESREFFESAHHRNAADLCKNLGVMYFCANNESELEKGLEAVKKENKASVLEVFTSPESNQSFFNHYKSLFHGI